MSKSRGLISGSESVHSRTSGMYDSNDNVRIANISNNGLSSLGFLQSIIAENINTTPYDFAWSLDGLHLNVVDSGDYIFHYTVTKPFTDTGKTQVGRFSVLYYDSSNYSFEMSPDGKYFYCGGPGRDGIFMFTSSVPYYLMDTTTATTLVSNSRTNFAYGYNQINQYLVDTQSIGSIDTYVRGVSFNGDGTKFYMTGWGDDNVQQFSLSTPYKIGDANDSSAYDGEYDLNLTGPHNMRWNDDGSKLFVPDTDIDSITEYSVSNAYDLTTGTVTKETSYNVGSYESTPYDVAFNADGTKMFVIGSGSDKIHEWTLSTGFDLSSTLTYVSGTSLGLTNPTAFDFSPDGTFMAVVDYSSDTLKGYTLSTGFDSSTISATQSHDMSSTEGGYTSSNNINNYYAAPTACRFNGDGTTITLLDVYSSSYDKASSIPLLIPYDIRGLADGYLNTVAQGMNNPWAIRFDRYGTKVYVLDGSDDQIYQWTLHTPYALGRGTSVSTFDGKSSYVNDQDSHPRGFDWTPDGRGIFVIGEASDVISFYMVEIPWDVTSTLTYKHKYDLTHIDSNPYTVRLVNCHNRNDGGYKFHILGTTTDDMYEFNVNF